MVVQVKESYKPCAGLCQIDMLVLLLINIQLLFRRTHHHCVCTNNQIYHKDNFYKSTQVRRKSKDFAERKDVLKEKTNQPF